MNSGHKRSKARRMMKRQAEHLTTTIRTFTQAFLLGENPGHGWYNDALHVWEYHCNRIENGMNA